MPASNDAQDLIPAAGEERILNALPDAVDLRDRMYEPALLQLKLTLDPPELTDADILNQFSEGACTGFALAAVINVQNKRRRAASSADPQWQVSARMLYEMARIHDEWPGEEYDGSSIRGAVKGFFHNGVCSVDTAPYVPNDNDWTLTVDQSKEARAVGLGAYYRLRPEILDYHSALNEVGSIIVSAQTHSGWSNPKQGKIAKSMVHQGGHAFAIVGYDSEGFLIQNSWGPTWGGFDGREGIAHWSYADWAENVIDAWVLRLSVPTPAAFHLTNSAQGKAMTASGEAAKRATPRRQDILGHFIHIDDGKLVEEGRYGTNLATIGETARLIRERGDAETPKYRHLMIYAHGGLNDNATSARRIAAMRDVYKRNGIYPVHIMWETGFTEELTDVLADTFSRSQDRVGAGRDMLDWAIERFSGGIGKRLWRQMKVDAKRPFEGGRNGGTAIKMLLDENAKAKNPMSVHLVGHSAGSILAGELLGAMPAMGHGTGAVHSCNLLAPACTIDFYDAAYRPALGAGGVVQKLVQYSLIDSRELDDTVGPYGKSLLYFVSRAFEEERKTPLLGMEKYAGDMDRPGNHEIFYAGRDRKQTDSPSHGGFDNDRSTMNDVLATILGKKPSRADGFQDHELTGY